MMKHTFCMRIKSFFLLFVSIQTFLLAPLSPLWAQDAPDIDFIAPDIDYKPSGEAATAAKPMTVTAKITDDKGVKNATLFYRPTGKEVFLQIPMTANDNDIYTAVIPGEAVFEPRIEYYLAASDISGNTIFKGSASSPLAVSVVAAIVPMVIAPKEESVGAGSKPALQTPEPPLQKPPEPFALTTKIEPTKPWYKKWWVWTIVGAVVIGVAASHGGGTEGNGGSVTVNGPPPS